MKKRTYLAAVTGVTLALASSCVGGDGIKLPVIETETTPAPDPDTDPDADPADWTPGGPAGDCNVDALLQPQSYGSKVKSLLTGLSLTDVELQGLRADPTSLASLIDGWLETPESDAVLERFFMSAFQQTGGNRESLFYLLNRNNTSTGFYRTPRTATAEEMLNENFSESFARTVTEMNRQGQSFGDVLTTGTFMMTTAMMSFLAFTDDEVIHDDGSRTARVTFADFDTITLVRDAVDAPTPSEAMDPNSPSFATFWHPNLAAQLDPVLCDVQPSQAIDTTQITNGEWRISVSAPFFAFSAIVLGRVQRVRRQNVAGCSTNASNVAPLLDRGDFSDWRMVEIRRPEDVETPDIFYRADDLRASNELRLNTPRVGFFTTPGFQSTWMTNEDNSSRVTINQTLIVALGSSFEGETVTDFSPANIDEAHADPQSACYGCHQTLDPMRDYMRASFTNFYGEQLDPERTALEADFVFGGEQEQGNGVFDLAEALLSHPRFAHAWANKLCYYANGNACAKGDELDRVVDAFVTSGLDFSVLVRELFSSPLITGSECVSGVDAGTTATIARRSTFCNGLSHRLGVDDLCGLRTNFRDADALTNDVRDAVASVPDDSFSRSEVRPVVIAETGLFTRANREAACSIIAQGSYTAVFGGLSSGEAIDAMLQGVMALPPADSRHDAVREVLVDHVTDVVASGQTEAVALQSALALACMSPGASGVGF